MSATQLALSLPHRQALGREDFLVVPGNAEAVAAIDAWPRWSSRALIVTGPAGSGKTHLGAVFAQISGAEICAAADLHVSHVPALADAPAVIIENVDAQPIDERALFHLFNLVMEQERYILLTAREAPKKWPIALADLKSRMLGSLHLQLGAPDDALLAGLIRKHLADRQISLRDEALIPYLVSHMERTADAAKDVVRQLDERSLASGRRIGLKLATELFADK